MNKLLDVAVIAVVTYALACVIRRMLREHWHRTHWHDDIEHHHD